MLSARAVSNSFTFVITFPLTSILSFLLAGESTFCATGQNCASEQRLMWSLMSAIDITCAKETVEWWRGAIKLYIISGICQKTNETWQHYDSITYGTHSSVKGLQTYRAFRSLCASSPSSPQSETLRDWRGKCGWSFIGVHYRSTNITIDVCFSAGIIVLRSGCESGSRCRCCRRPGSRSRAIAFTAATPRLWFSHDTTGSACSCWWIKQERRPYVTMLETNEW